MKIFNLNADEWDRTEEREGWRFKDAWVGAHTDAELIGASMYEVEPGNKQGPFHTHHANEEWAIVLRGEPTLRTHEGEQQLCQGDDRRAFPAGGGHSTTRADGTVDPHATGGLSAATALARSGLIEWRGALCVSGGRLRA